MSTIYDFTLDELKEGNLTTEGEEIIRKVAAEVAEKFKK